jgi:apolipoprotein N-acyltransferase
MVGKQWLYRFVGLASGLLLVVPHFYPVLSPIQFLAFSPILYLMGTGFVRHRDMLAVGMYMGIAYTLPQIIVLRLPLSMTLILLLYTTALLMIFTSVSAWLFAGSAIAGAFAVGAILVVLDWVNFTLVPIWGTAQSFVRPWSRYPALIAFVSVTGITGIIFLLGTLQALFVKLTLYPKQRVKLLAATATVVLLFAATNIVVRHQQPTSKLKVAAVGWIAIDSSESNDVSSPQGFRALFEQPVAKAASEGAQLIVSPEMGFYYGYRGREEFLKRLREVARRYNIFLAVGYFSDDEQKNRLLFMSPHGTVVGEYTKTYLTPFEDYRKGDGKLAIIDVEGVSVGAMICHDDNFTSLSREYGRKGVSVVVVPTLDWSEVKGAHFQNSIHRAIESRYAIVRAAMNGISAIISPTGEVLAQMDHFVHGPGVVVAEVPVYGNPTVFSIVGHWPVPLSFVFLAIYIVYNFAAPGSRNIKPGQHSNGLMRCS